MPYYNTTGEEGEELSEYKKVNDTREQEILRFFERHWMHEMSPSRVWQAVCPEVPITSVRRAITDLTTAGRLEKTWNKADGPYGRREYLWKYKKEITIENATQMKLPL